MLNMSFGQVGWEVRNNGVMEVRKEKSACFRNSVVVLAYALSFKCSMGTVIVLIRWCAAGGMAPDRQRQWAEVWTD